jgi:metacaspase-1
MSKKALLVGINNFTRPEWALKGCINDTLEMQELLGKYYGFKKEDIKLLHDKDATNQGIRDGLSWLLDGSQSGDVRVFHFSSHGTQVDDQSGDEWECLDEVIVPYDHDWDKPFRDDDLRAIFEMIPKGVAFTFIADCCHSGSIQKALFESRVKFNPRFLTPPREIQARIEAKQAKRDAEFDAWAGQQLPVMLQGVPPDQWSSKISVFMKELRERFRQNKYAIVDFDRDVLLAACEDRQTAADAKIGSKWRGAFTWAVGKAIRAAKGDLTYEALIQQAAANLTSYEQKPQLECPTELQALKLFDAHS